MFPRHSACGISRRARTGAVWRLAAILPVLLVSAACSIFSPKEDLGTDIPADRLYNEGVFLLNEKKALKEAAKKFEEVDRQHPYSEWARKALLMSSYSNYEAKQYDEAISAGKRYIALHPGSPDVAYAYYLVAVSEFEQISDVSRDQSRTEKAIGSLEEVIRKFPESEYAGQARRKIEVARDNLAAYEMQVARFYQSRKNFIGAINRFKVVVTQYQTTRHVEEALMRLTECYMALGIVQEAQTAAAGGRVEVASRPGAGTRFSIRLPLTLAVTQTLLVEALGRSWAVPANMIVQAMELKPDALQAMQRAHGIEWQGEHYPYRYLPRLLGDREARPAEARYSWVLLLRAGAQTLALHVDGLRGNQEVIVKNAGPQLTRVVGMSGATVLGDGEIVLILNPVALGARAATTTDEAHAGLFGPAAEAPPPLHLPTVMVVDDSLTVRKITGRLLEREGYRVLTAKDGVDALEQLIDLKPDVVLTDIEMPRMDGFDLVRNIRADARLHDLPVVVITSRLAEKHRRYALEVGADHYLGKPYQEEELLALVARYAQAGKG